GLGRIERTHNFFTERLIIGCSTRPIWIQRFWGFRGQLNGCVAHLAGHYCPSQNCGCSSVGRAPPCQGGRREFEPRHPLQPSLGAQRKTKAGDPCLQRGSRGRVTTTLSS